MNKIVKNVGAVHTLCLLNNEKGKNKIDNRDIYTNASNFGVENTAITLIALIITIIVLLILAGVTINMLIGENGILKKASVAKEETAQKQALEELNMKVLEVQINKNGNATLQDIVDYLDEDSENEYMISTKIATINGEIPDLTGKTEINIKYKGYWFRINASFEVSILGKEDDNSSTDVPEQQIGDKTEFDYTGNYQEYEVKDTGYYKIECYGASGGSNRWYDGLIADYGTGGYASGIIKLNKGEKLYVYVGQKGEDGNRENSKKTSTSFNGGGAGIGSSDADDGGGAGGGATDIRLIAGEWDNFESLKSRIMVAGGGSGGATVSGTFNGKSGGSGGGTEATGSVWKYSNTENNNHTYNATQTTGYRFGIGQDAITKGYTGGAGAGGGYYGGYSSSDSPAGGAGGGSGFISGYGGCDAISKESTENNIIHTGKSIHYSGKCFTNATLLDGNDEEIEDQKDNGYASIEFLGNNADTIQLNKKETFRYTGSYQEYEVENTGYYKIECYGASGGSDNWANSLLANYGTGGYASGTIKLNKGEKLYIYVGQKGENGTIQRNKKTSTTFNGGGAGIGSADGDDGGGAGGGATDIRLVAGEWDNFESLKSRIMVAGGGSGGATVSGTFNGKSGGSGGGTEATGSVWKYSNTENNNHTYNATQTTGYRFGIGQDAITKGYTGGAGAGGGYYGGYSSSDSPAGGAGGGSGFVSGYEGCDAISKESTENNIIHTGKNIHYSGKYFTNAVLKDGNSGVAVGNTSDGRAIITFLGNNN